MRGGGMVLLFLPVSINIKYSLDFKVVFLGDPITDERGHVHQNLGLLPIVKKKDWNPYTDPWIRLPETIGIKNEPAICFARNVGMPAWKLGNKLYVIDYFALTEPYLARIPARTGQRVGHYARAFPKGYLETLVTGENVIADPTLADLYDDVTLAAHAPLWKSNRWGAIWRLNTGYHKGKFQGFDRNDLTPLGDMIPLEFLRPQDIAEFYEHIAALQGGWYNHILLPLRVPPAFSPFINQPSSIGGH